MMHLVEVFLFEQFFISPFGFLCYYDSLIELVLDLPDFILEVFAFFVLGWDFLYVGGKDSFLDVLIPFLLEVAESFVHFVLDEEVSEEEIDRLSLCSCLGSYLVF